MEDDQEQSKRGRKRDPEIYEVVLQATFELLWEVGYKNLSVEKIVKRSNVTKVTIYKWWPSLPLLVLEVMDKKFKKDDTIIDTGNFEDDMRLMVQEGVKKLKPRKLEIMRYLMAEAQVNAEFKKIFDKQIICSTEGSFLFLLERAQLRGEIKQIVDIEMVTHVCWAYFWYGLFRDRPFDSEEFLKLVMTLTLVSK